MGINRQYSLYSIALFLISLVLTLPFFSVSALAAGINDVTIVGTDGVENIGRPNDILFMNVEADLDGTTVMPEFLSLSVSGHSIPFPEICLSSGCTLKDGSEETYDCTCQQDFQLPRQITFSLYNDTEHSVFIDTSDPVDVYPDVLAPAIEITSHLVDENSVVVEYTASDSASPSTVLCSGLTSVDIYRNNAYVQTESVDSGEGAVCAYSDAAQISLVEGSNIIFLRAWDSFYNHTESSILNISTDYTMPQILPGFELFRNGEELQAVSTIGPESSITDAEIVFSVRDANLENITADLSLLNVNPAYSSNYEHIVWRSTQSESGGLASCSNEDESDPTIWTCRVSGIFVDVDSGSLSISVHAEDLFSNSADAVLTLELQTDNTAPVATFIGTENCVDNVCYINQDRNSVLVEIDEAGTGFSMHQYPGGGVGYRIILNLASMGYSSPMMLTQCTETNGHYSCTGAVTVRNNPLTGDSLYISLTDSSMDDLGNPVQGLRETSLIFDDETPRVLNMFNSSSCPTSVEPLIIETVVQEEISGMRGVSVDTSQISALEEQQGACLMDEDGKYICTISIGYLSSITSQSTLHLKFEDNAGNILSYNYPLNICQADATVASPNFWRHTVAGNFNLARRAVSYGGVHMYALVSLAPISGNPTLINVNEGSCAPIIIQSDNSETPITTTVSSLSILNTDDRNVLMKIGLPEVTFPESQEFLEINCSIQIISRVGNSVYTNPETEYVIFEAILNDNALGTIDESVQDKINAAISKHHDLTEKIEQKENINRILGGIANTARLMAAVKAMLGIMIDVLAVLSTILINLGWSLAWLPGVGAGLFHLGMFLWNGVAKGLFVFFMGIDKFVWPAGIGFVGGAVVGGVVKWTSMVYSCALCDFNSVSDITDGIANVLGSDNVIMEHSGRGEFDWGQWNDAGKPNGLFIDQLGILYDFDPYRSIHVARSCLCLPAIEYNLRKEQQINCDYINCLRESSEVGLSTSHCEEAKRVYECLYVDGAAWEELGWGSGGYGEVAGFFQQAIGAVIQNLLHVGGSVAYTMGCTPIMTTTVFTSYFPWFVDSLALLGCMNANVALTYVEINTIDETGEDFSREQYYGPLENDIDRCGGIE